MPSPRLARLMKRSAIGVVCLAVLLAVWIGGVYVWHWHTFPYGFSHCLKQLGMAHAIVCRGTRRPFSQWRRMPRSIVELALSRRLWHGRADPLRKDKIV